MVLSTCSGWVQHHVRPRMRGPEFVACQPCKYLLPTGRWRLAVVLQSQVLLDLAAHGSKAAPQKEPH